MEEKPRHAKTGSLASRRQEVPRIADSQLRNEKSAQRGSFWPDVPADIRSKTSVNPPNRVKTSIVARTSRRMSMTKLRSEHLLKVARLQSEFCTKDFFRATNFFTKNAPKFSPKFLTEIFEPLFRGSEKSRKIPSKFPTEFSKFPCEKKKSPTSFCRSAGRTSSGKFCVLYQHAWRYWWLLHVLPFPDLSMHPFCAHIHDKGSSKSHPRLACLRARLSQRFRKGVGGRGLATNRPQKHSQKSPPEICPPSPKGA